MSDGRRDRDRTGQGGSLSLYVDFADEKAVRLYEKTGRRRKYARMLYVGGEGGS